jgi:transposase
MGRGYSLDLRNRVVAFVEQGHSRRAAAEHFSVSPSFAVKLLQRVARTGSEAPSRQGRPPGKDKLAGFAGFLVKAVESQPDITMPELAAKLQSEHGIKADPAVLSRFLCRRGFTYKKSPDGIGMRTGPHPLRQASVD